MDAPSNDNPYLPPIAAKTWPGTDPLQPALKPGLEVPQPHIGWALLAVIGFFGAQFAVGIAVAIVGIAIGGVNAIQKSPMPEFLITAGSFTTCLYAAALTVAVHKHSLLKRMAWRTPSVWQVAFVLMAFLPFGVVVSEMNNWLIPYMPTIGMNAMLEFAAMPVPLIVIAMCVFPAVGEELLFRGFIGRGLVGRYGPVAGILVTSFIFGAVHIEPLQAISAFFLGIVLHVIYLTSKSIIVPMLLHFLNNLFALLSMRYADDFPLPGISVVGEEGVVVHTPYLIVLVAGALSVLLLVLFYQSRSGWRTFDGQPWRFPYVTAESPPDESIQAQSRTPNAILYVLAIGLFGVLLWLLWKTAHQWAG